MDIILKYGSKARGDSDSFSDCDLLVVGSIPHDHLFKQMDIVRYTKNRFEKLRDVKSLFLVHLRDEGVILKDHKGWMVNFLNSIPDYKPTDEVVENAYKNLSCIVSIIPHPAALPCWFDMLYVFMRDLFVKLNALENRYVFSPELLLDEIDLQNRNTLKNVFAISRKIKSNYRNGIPQKVFINSFDVIKLLVESLNLDTSPIDFRQLVDNPKIYDPYLALRLVEYGLRAGIFQSADNKLKKYIKNPNKYSWDIKQIKWANNIKFVEPHHSPDQLQPAAFAGR